MRRIAVTLVCLALIGAACSGDGSSSTTAGGPTVTIPADAFTVVASSDLAVGRDRLLLGVVGEGNLRLGGPDVPVAFEIFPEGDPGAVKVVDATWVWAVPGQSGLYRADIDFDRSGVWLVRVVPEVGVPLVGVPLQVREIPLGPALGAPAPRSNTPTAGEFELADISTDVKPDPKFYELSVADAVTSGRRSVIVFATPLFCQTAVCGPTLDTVKAISAGYPDVNWVHVEIFTNLDQPANREIVPYVAQWGLTTEPWVFVVDAKGLVEARFEGVVDAAELEEVLGPPA